MKKFYYSNYTEWHGNGYETITKVFAEIPQTAMVEIAKQENWNGLHWDHPALVFSESVEGLEMSAEANAVVKALNAKCDDDCEEENTEETYKPSLLQQWLINKS